MLNRPGYLIRRLISSSRPRLDDDDDAGGVYDEEDLISVKTFVLKPTRSKSWLPSSRKKRPPSPIPVRPAHSIIHRISSPLPPVPAFITQTSSSSLLSLCSCEGHSDVATGNFPVKQKAASALCLTEHGRTRLHSNPPKHPTRPWNGLFGGGDAVTLSAGNSPRPSISLSSADADRPELQPSQSQAALDHDECPGGWSENVQRLILETDEAFKAVGSALAEAKLEKWPGIEDLNASAPSPIIRRHSKPMPLTTGLRKDQRSRDNASPSPLGSPARSASVKKSTKKAAKKTRYGFVRPGKPQVRVPKWTLSDNVTDILTGQRFRRIEADEMVTPDRIEEFRRTREEAEQNEDRLKRRNSNDSVQRTSSDKTETPVEPFHPGDLAPQIEVVGKDTASAVEPAPPSIPSDCDVIHRDLSIPSDLSKERRLSSGLLVPTSPYKPKTCALPSLPTKSTKSSSLGQNTLLPTIPEVMVTTPDNTQLQPSTHRRSHDKHSLKPEENDEFYYLKSTPYTLTRPAFRHGPITFSKAEMSKGVKPMDDTLDWTAFQMAILGAGDLFPDMSLEDDIKQEADIASWFESFGFETHGKLVADGMTSPQATPQSSFTSSPSTVDTDAEPPIPLGAEYPSGFWNMPSEEQSKETDKFFSNTGLKRWIAEERPRRYTSQSSDSLPPSPMMPLMVQTEDIGGDEARETVPMGYNLGHDLGDFLKWEAQHAYAGGFNGSS